MSNNHPRKSEHIGERLRTRRTDTLKKGLREMARLLEITPAHLTDLEKGRRAPSDDLLIKLSTAYDIDESVLRAGWHKAEAVVGEVATQDETTAAKVPQFLRQARNLSPEQWDQMIKQAEKLSGSSKRKGPGK